MDKFVVVSIILFVVFMIARKFAPDTTGILDLFNTIPSDVPIFLILAVIVVVIYIALKVKKKKNKELVNILSLPAGISTIIILWFLFWGIEDGFEIGGTLVETARNGAKSVATGEIFESEKKGAETESSEELTETAVDSCTWRIVKAPVPNGLFMVKMKFPTDELYQIEFKSHPGPLIRFLGIVSDARDKEWLPLGEIWDKGEIPSWVGFQSTDPSMEGKISYRTTSKKCPP